MNDHACGRGDRSSDACRDGDRGHRIAVVLEVRVVFNDNGLELTSRGCALVGDVEVQVEGFADSKCDRNAIFVGDFRDEERDDVRGGLPRFACRVIVGHVVVWGEHRLHRALRGKRDAGGECVKCHLDLVEVRLRG